MERQLARLGDHRRRGLGRQRERLGLQLLFLLRGLNTWRELGRGKVRRNKAGAEQQRDVPMQNHGKPPWAILPPLDTDNTTSTYYPQHPKSVEAKPVARRSSHF